MNKAFNLREDAARAYNGEIFGIQKPGGLLKQYHLSLAAEDLIRIDQYKGP